MQIDMVKAHFSYLKVHIYRTCVENHQWKDLRIKPLLLDLGLIGALITLNECLGPVFDSGFFTPSAAKYLNMALDQMLKKIRPQLIPLVEAKSEPDIVNPSNIGNYFGDIYETQIEWAKDSSLNHLDIGGVPPQWELYIKPFLHEEPQIKDPRPISKLARIAEEKEAKERQAWLDAKAKL